MRRARNRGAAGCFGSWGTCGNLIWAHPLRFSRTGGIPVIIGIGVDVVDIERFTATLQRVPRLREKLFTEPERNLAPSSLAARFAAKEAIAKALGSPGTLLWQDATIRREPGSQPVVELSGTVAERAAQLGVSNWHLSLSHDGGVAIAMVVAEGR